MIQLGESDGDSQRSLAQGEEVVIRLAENPTTGYQWQLSVSGSARLELVEDSLERGAAGAVGAGGFRVVRYRAQGVGSVQIEALHRRAWEDKPLARRVFRLEVR
jgi:inhibitor of cysteine peptidase